MDSATGSSLRLLRMVLLKQRLALMQELVEINLVQILHVLPMLVQSGHIECSAIILWQLIDQKTVFVDDNRYPKLNHCLSG